MVAMITNNNNNNLCYNRDTKINFKETGILISHAFWSLHNRFEISNFQNLFYLIQHLKRSSVVESLCTDEQTDRVDASQHF
jgi:hypothetical protein